MKKVMFKVASAMSVLLMLLSVSVWLPNMVKAQYRDRESTDYRLLDEYGKRLDKAEVTLDHLKSIEVAVTTATELFKWELGLLSAAFGTTLIIITKWVMGILKTVRKDQLEIKHNQTEARHSMMNLLGMPMISCLQEKHPELAKDLENALRRINSGRSSVHDESENFRIKL